MLQIVYASASTKVMTPIELTHIVDNGLRKNLPRNITGFVIYDQGSFLQIIEGPEEPVQALFQRICQDPRHTNIRVLVQKQIADREFGDWCMTFYIPPGADAPDSGFIDYTTVREELTLDGSEASQILSLFQDGLLRQAKQDNGAKADFTVTVGTKRTAIQGRQARFLLDFGRALAMTVPDVEIGVRLGDDDPIHFNLHRDMQMGEIEIF